MAGACQCTSRRGKVRGGENRGLRVVLAADMASGVTVWRQGPLSWRPEHRRQGTSAAQRRARNACSGASGARDISLQGCSTGSSQGFWTKLRIAKKTKVVDHLTSFNFHKGWSMCYSIDWPENSCKVCTFLGLVKQVLWALTGILRPLHFESQMPPIRWNMFHEKLDNIYIGIILST
jgi:hypothetical protein